MPKLYIVSITCEGRSESSGWNDEIFLKINGSKVWPGDHYANIKKGETIKIDYSEPIYGDVTIELWEYDDESPHDLLGSVTANQFTLHEHSGTVHGDGGVYKITYRVG